MPTALPEVKFKLENPMISISSRFEQAPAVLFTELRLHEATMTVRVQYRCGSIGGDDSVV
jgi:hypothetical protein